MNSFEIRLAGKFPAAPRLSSKVLLAAVSGGADSTAMLAALAALRDDAGFILHCVHIEHGIRPADESRGDALAVEALCKKLDVPYKIISIPNGRIAAFAARSGSGIEAAARIFRMKALHRERRRIGAERILIAHTSDDLLENLLMRILRGSGPRGLAAMPVTRGQLFRPLLDFTRQDVLEYLEEKGLSYRTDSTNADIRFLRNKVRHKLIPVLDSFFPSWRVSLPALAETQSLTADFLADETGKRLPWEREDSAALRLKEADFLNAPQILREEAIFNAVDMLAVSDSFVKVPRRAVVHRAADRLCRFSPAEDLGLVRLCRRNGYIEIKKTPKARSERGFSLLINKAGVYTFKGKVFDMGKAELRIEAAMETSAAPSVFHAQFPLVFRNHREGDRLLWRGHKRSFSDIIERGARPEYTGIITAADAEGPAAFICLKRNWDLLVLERQSANDANSAFFTVKVKLVSSKLV